MDKIKFFFVTWSLKSEFNLTNIAHMLTLEPDFVLITLVDQQTTRKTLQQREKESQSGFRLLKLGAYNLTESQGASGKPLS